MPLQATSGAASYDAFGGGVPVVPNYIEDVFQTWLYTGTGAAQTITNNIDLSGKGGLVWCKSRSSSISHGLSDTVTGRTKALRTNNFANQVTTNDSITSFNSNGFSLGTDLDTGWFNTNLANYVSWTFREQPKFFDIVTWTGNASNRTIAHSLGSVPGCIIVKRRDDDADWQVYHRSLANTEYLVPNTTAAKATGATRWNSTTATDTVFSIGTDATVNASGGTYVAYLFAHDAGGFGLTGTDNVISCGTFTTDGAGTATVNLGYEPQWILYKGSSAVTNWELVDNMRGFVAGAANAGSKYSNANTSGAEFSSAPVGVTSTGFNFDGASSNTYIYIAIRRGPMKVPTVGTSVFAPVLNTGTSTNTFYSSGGFAPDMLWNKNRDHSYGAEVWDKLRGVRAVGLTTSNTGAEGLSPAGYDLVSFNNTGVTEGSNSGSVMNISTWLYVNYMFGRAPSVFDIVCYTGNSTVRTLNHNLGVAPEMILIKSRDGINDWAVYHAALGNTKYLQLNTTAASVTDSTVWNSTTPTSSVFTLGTSYIGNWNPKTHVSYLFSTCVGVSKVGSYTGTATTKQIDCGFTGGARFVLIKRTDATGDWYLWDSARGIIAGNDPYLLLNSTATEVTNTDYVDTYSAGFEISSTAPAAINASGGSYIFLAIA
jgi:hypothetical protein